MTDQAIPTITADDFQRAMQMGQLSLAYQPIVELKNSQPLGFEALMRWNHPELGAIPPSAFIPVAEESGLIVLASRWALKEACRALKRIEGALGYDVSFFMSVNFSATDFDDKNFLEQLYTIISVTDIEPSHVHIEITEKLLRSQPDKARETLALCAGAGLGISLDDFTEDPAILEELHGFGIDTLKIDEISESSVRAVIDEAKRLGMITIAEGVEESDDAVMLRAMGCDMAQGYYFARPVDEAQTIAVLRQWPKKLSA